jgi:hypothetical protein
MIFQHDERGHHLGGASHWHRGSPAGAPAFAEAVDEEGRFALRRPGQRRRGSNLLHRRDDRGCRGHRERLEVLEGRGRQQQREQVWKWTADE